MSINWFNNSALFNMADNFTSTEIRCKCGKCSRSAYDSKLVEFLQSIRNHFKKPVYISSAYRCKEWNVAVGGTENSYHTKGQAADIVVDGVSPRDVAEYAEILGIKGIGLYDENNGNFVHIDTRDYKSFWLNHSQDYIETFQSIGIVNITDVSYMQMVFCMLGHKVKIDGIYGDETNNAVIKFQKAHNLKADGIIGPKTYNKMIEEVKKRC